MNENNDDIIIMTTDEESNNVLLKQSKNDQESDDDGDANRDDLVLGTSKDFNDSTTNNSDDKDGSSFGEGFDGDDPRQSGNFCGYKLRLAIFGIAFVLGFALCFVEVEGDKKITQTAAIASKFRCLFVLSSGLLVK